MLYIYPIGSGGSPLIIKGKRIDHLVSNLSQYQISNMLIRYFKIKTRF